MLKRIVILLLVMMLCVGSMTSCMIELNDKTEGVELNTELPVETLAPAPERLPNLPDALSKAKAAATQALDSLTIEENFAGLSLSVVIVEDVEFKWDTELETSYAKALRLQSDMVAKKLGCVVEIKKVPYNTFLADAQAYLNSGLFYADVVCVPQKALGYMKGQNLLAELNGLYGDVFTEDYFYANSKLQGTGSNKLYGIAGKAAVNPAAYTCVYLNKAMSDSLGITEEIYSLVESGGWTVDAMLAYRDKFAQTYPEAVTVGAAKNDTIIESFFGATGMNYLGIGADGIPAVANNGEKLNGFVAKLRAVLNDATQCYCGENAYELFEQSKLLFYVDTFEIASALKGDYTVLPLPKYDAEQASYNTFASGEAYVYAVLSTNNRTEYADTLIKALNATSDLMVEGWARDLLDYALRNEQSYKNAKEMFVTPNYDFAYMYGDVYTGVAESSYKALKNAVLSDKDFSHYAGLQTWNLRNDMLRLFS